MSLGSNNSHVGSGTLPPIHFEDSTVNDTSDSSNRLYHKPPSEYEDQIWHLGWTDGRHGQPAADNIALIRARARLLWQERADAADAEIAATRARVRSLEGSLGRLRERLDLVTGDYLKLLHDRGENPQSYSLSLWLIYSLGALLLLAADLPLSLKLVAMGYGVTTENKVGSVDKLLEEPWKVLNNFWEAVLLAIGVALAGILIKYLLDSLVYRDEQKTLSRVSKGVLLGILGLFLVTTICLGFFRADVQRQKHIDELNDRVMALKKLGDDPEIVKEIKEVEHTRDQEQSESMWSMRTASFILLTLLFPIAGGICFSIGWRKLVKRLRFWSVWMALKKAEWLYGPEALRYEQARGALESLEAKRRRDNEAHAGGDSYAEMLVSLYRHGYARGRNVPETVDAGASLYKRCEKAVAKMLAGKLRAAYWGGQPSGPSDVN
jgi:hypothetical protein